MQNWRPQVGKDRRFEHWEGFVSASGLSRNWQNRQPLVLVMRLSFGPLYALLGW